MAIGISMVTGMLTKEHIALSTEDDDLGSVGMILMGFLLPLLTLFFGWIAVQFV